MPKIVKRGISINIIDPETGKTYLYLGGQEVPDEHAAFVKHDLAWETGKEPNDAPLLAARRANAADPTGDPPRGRGGYPGSTPPSPENDNLEELSVRALHDVARNEEIDLGDATRKADIIATIRTARAEG